jgi:hypothetical protein
MSLPGCFGLREQDSHSDSNLGEPSSPTEPTAPTVPTYPFPVPWPHKDNLTELARGPFIYNTKHTYTGYWYWYRDDWYPILFPH